MSVRDNQRHDVVFARIEAADKDTLSGPHGWIQWKGTSVCMDVHCACGKLTHVDSDFVYQIKCGACGRLYAVSGNVRLVPIDASEVFENVLHETTAH